MRNHYKAVLLFVMALILLSGCSASFKEEQGEALLAVEKAFTEKPKETNKDNKDISYYLPFGFEVEDETPNNIILKNGAKTYILFYNLHENNGSDVVLDATLQQKKYDVKEQFQEGEKLGFFLVKKGDNKVNEVTVGIGGVKVTGEVKTNSMTTEAETMMQIVNSVQFNK